MPGLGQIYCGNARRGNSLYLLFQICILLSSLSLLIPVHLINLLLALLLFLGFWLFILIDSFQLARKCELNYELRSYNRWYVYLLAILVAVFLIRPTVKHTIRAYVVASYHVPTGAMSPTLEIGDFVLVNRLTYRSENPERGDVVVFAYPRDPSKLFVKRIIGIAGDLVEAIDKEMYLNGESLNEDYVVHTDSGVYPAEVSPRDIFGPVSVPPNSVFVLGDNRDNSHDSRFYGAVATHQIKGKVFSIYWSWDAERHKPRWERCGSIDK